MQNVSTHSFVGLCLSLSETVYLSLRNMYPNNAIFSCVKQYHIGPGFFMGEIEQISRADKINCRIDHSKAPSGSLVCQGKNAPMPISGIMICSTEVFGAAECCSPKTSSHFLVRFIHFCLSNEETLPIRNATLGCCLRSYRRRPQPEDAWQYQSMPRRLNSWEIPEESLCLLPNFG